MEKINKKKVSQLPEAATTKGFYAFGTDNNNNSVKVPIDLLKGNKGDIGEQGEKGDDGNSVAHKTIFNVSQHNNKYDYADSTTARNGVPLDLRGLGQQITYKLASGKWVTEQYIGTDINGWEIVANWEEIGFSEKKLVSIDGIGYKEIKSTPTFNNIITEFSYVEGKYLWNGNEASNAVWHYNAVYIPVQPNTEYLFSTNLDSAIQFYNSDKTFIGQNASMTLGSTFTTPAACAFVRYSFPLKTGLTEYIYPAPTVATDNNLSINIDVSKLQGATRIDASINSGNIIPSDVVLADKALDKNAIATIPNFHHTESYIPILGGVDYETNLSNAIPFMWFYDSEKRAIKYIGTASTGLPFGTFKTPVNTAYIRFNISSTNVAPFYIKKHLAGGAYYISNLVIPKSNVIDIDSSPKTPIELIPYASDGNTNTTNFFFSYINQSAIRGKYISSVKLNVAAPNSTIIIAFCADSQGASVLWQKTFTSLAIGENALEIDRMLGASEFLCVKGNYKFYTGRPNSVGGGLTGNNVTQNNDLCIGVYGYGEESIPGKTFDYTSCGDSISFGYGATTPYSKLLSLKLGGAFANRAVNAAKCIGSSGNVLLSQINNIPEGYSGIVTIMIGINDVAANSVLGDVPTVLAKSYNTLNADSSFAEAFRLCLETLLIKAPNAIVLVIPPLKAWTGKETKIESYRQVERDICEYFAIPYTDIYRQCSIAPLTYSRLMPDALHPNDAGHLEVMRVLWGDIEKLISYIKG